MRWPRSPVYMLAVTLAMPAWCRPKQKDAAKVAEQAVAEAREVVRDQAWKDLQADLTVVKTELKAVSELALSKSASPQQRGARASAALYSCERLALASRELSDDARAQAKLGEADTLCAYQAPLAAGEARLAVLESARGTSDPPRAAPPECGGIKEALGKVGAKYRNDAKLIELAGRFKTDCPRVKLFGGHSERSSSSSSSSSGSSSSGSGSRPDPGAQRQECRQRCDSAAFSCRASCQYCGSCTNDKTLEWCHATCNNCKSECEQNEKFCMASCGG